MEQATIGIQGMSCGHCVASVKRALDQLESVEVQEVKVGSARVSYDPATVTPDRIKQAIEDEGYTAQLAGSQRDLMYRHVR
ncbi:MAG TPA: cation transporter [Longimicrobium sp.]|nr:cation transporter [Longimicrobium sp.]